MPILKPTDPLLSIVPDQFVSWLPENTITAANAAPIIRSLTAAGFGQAYMRNATGLSAQIGRVVSLTSGWAEVDLGKLGAMVDVAMGGLDVDAVRKMFEALTDAIPQVIAQAGEAISEAISAVPIIGWLVKIGFATWKLVKSALDAKPTAEALALGYSRELDQFVTNELLNIARGKDWSEIFRPPNDDFGWLPIAYTNSGAADGVAWGQIDGKGAPKALRGVMPGVASIAGYWQSPRDQPGSSRFAERSAIVGQGQMLPSVLALAGQLWAIQQKPGSALGRIDFVGLRNEWKAYGDELRKFAKKGGGSGKRGEWFTAQVLAAFSYGDKWGNAFFGVPIGKVPQDYREAYGGPDGLGLDALIAWKTDVAWQRIIRAMQWTEGSAYMAPDCPFLRNADSGVRKLHDDARRDLLQRWTVLARVDPTLVPDKAYRDAVVAAIEHIPQRTPTKPGQQGGGAPPGAPFVIPAQTWTPPPKPKPGDDKPDLPALPGATEGSGAAAVVAVIALLLGFA